MHCNEDTLLDTKNLFIYLPIMHGCYKHYFYCTVSLIWLFYHFKINFWGDKVYYTELCTGIQWFILMYSTLDFQCTLHWKNRKNTADIKCDVHQIQVWFTLRISEWYQCDSPGDPVHITLDCTVCITSDLCVRIFCSVLWLTVSSSWLEFPWLHP